MATIVSALTALQTRRQAGQAMVEYGLILALVSVVAIVALKILGTDVNTVFQSVADAIAGA
jgi:pilus assembly protein Flp/PilA